MRESDGAVPQTDQLVIQDITDQDACMRLDLARLKTISEDVVSSLNRSLTVLSVQATEGGSDRAEVLVTVNGCHQDPCLHLVNVSRVQPDTFEQELRTKLTAALRSHPLN